MKFGEQLIVFEKGFQSLREGKTSFECFYRVTRRISHWGFDP